MSPPWKDPAPEGAGKHTNHGVIGKIRVYGLETTALSRSKTAARRSLLEGGRGATPRETVVILKRLFIVSVFSGWLNDTDVFEVLASSHFHLTRRAMRAFTARIFSLSRDQPLGLPPTFGKEFNLTAASASTRYG